MSDVRWIEDGHKIVFRLEKEKIDIFNVECPYEEGVSLCNKGRDNCVVRLFLSVYGTEINIGSAFIDGPVEIAWTPILGECDLDKEFAQIWTVPLDDVEFKTWKALKDK